MNWAETSILRFKQYARQVIENKKQIRVQSRLETSHNHLDFNKKNST